MASAKMEPEPAWKTTSSLPERKRKRNERLHQVQVRNRSRHITQTRDYALSQKLRKRIEHVFAEAKVCHGLGRARCRGLRAMRNQLTMTAIIQNIKCLVGFVYGKSKSTIVSTHAIGDNLDLRAFMHRSRLFKVLSSLSVFKSARHCLRLTLLHYHP